VGKRWRRTVGLAAVLGLLPALGLVDLALPAARANSSFSFTRLAGTDRYDTARLAAETAFPSGSARVLLANGSLAHFPDALAGSYLAGFDQAPILLTDATTIPAATTQALKELKANDVVILGGPAAVADSEASTLVSSGYRVNRIYNQDGCTSSCSRYDTMKSVAETPPAANVGHGGAGVPTAIVASGTNFPDALVSGPIGFADALPVLITDPNTLSSQTQAALTDLGIKYVYIPGGTAAVSTAVETQIQAMGITTRRFAGQDRTDTAAQVANYAIQKLGFTDTAVGLARGDDPADSLASAASNGRYKTPLLLTENPTILGSYSANYLTSHAGTLATGVIYGGTSAVSQSVQDQATADARTAAGVPLLTAVWAIPKDTVITLYYNEPIDCASVDANGSDYKVTYSSNAVGVTKLSSCQNSNSNGVGQVDLQMASNPSQGQTVTVTAQKGADGNTVLDPTDTMAEPAGDQSSTTLSPTFQSAAAAGSYPTMTVTYNENITCSSVDSDGSDYRVTLGTGPGVVDQVTAASCVAPQVPGTGSNQVQLTLATPPTNGDTVSVYAQVGTDKDTVTDSSGNSQPIGDWTQTSATNTGQPHFTASTSTIGKTTVTVTYDHPIVCSSVDRAAPFDYVVTDNGTADQVTGVSCSGTYATTVTITVATAPSAPSDSVKVTAQQGGDGNTVLDSQGQSQPIGDSTTSNPGLT